MEKFDLGIIGGGPAGYTAALHAASLGQKVVLFEKENIGGVCLNKGCIPTKSILHCSELFKKMTNSQDCGILAENVTLDYSKVIERKNQTIEKLKKGIELALKNSKVTVVKAEAQIIDSTTIKVANEILRSSHSHKTDTLTLSSSARAAQNDLPNNEAETYNCDRIICATGSSARIVKGLEFDHEFLLSSDDILNLDKLPQSILIIGSGAIGIEWARIMSNFGVETTVVELAPHLLPLADIEVSKRIERIFKTNKIKFYTETSVEKIEGENVILSNGETLNPEKVLVAIGRVPNDIEKIDGVKYIGDVSGEIQLAHYAIKQALTEVKEIPFVKELTPSVVYGSPEIAWVGKREQDLEAGTFQKSQLLISALGKAHCDNETEGFIKLLSQEGKIIGAHIVSAEASALLQQVIIAMQNDISVDKLKEVCFAHPTYSEGIFEALFRL